MIDLRLVAVHGLWIVGASIMLAAFSYSQWRAQSQPLSKADGITPVLSRSASGVTMRLAAAEPVIVLAIAPALLFPTPARLCVLALLPIVAWANRRVHGQTVPPTAFNVSLFLLLFMTAVSLGATFDIRNSLGKVAGVILGAVVFWSLARWTDSQARLAKATVAFLLAGTVLAIVGLLGTNWFGKFEFLAPVINRLPRAIRGLPGAEEGFQPNAVAGCLVLFIPVQIALLTLTARAWWSATWDRRRHLSLAVAQTALVALTTGTLVLTQSRGAWTGLTVAFVVFLLWYRRWTRALGIALFAGVAIVAIALGPQRLADLAISRSGPAMTQNVAGRIELWSRAIDGIRDFPLTGMGMNNFRRLMPSLYPTLLSTPELDVAHAHNHLLQAALDLGLPGLIAYTAIWLTVGALLWMVYRRSGERAYRAMAGGLGAGLIAHFIFSLTDVIPLGSKVGVLFWLTLALTVVLHRVALAPAADAPPA